MVNEKQNKEWGLNKSALSFFNGQLAGVAKLAIPLE